EHLAEPPGAFAIDARRVDADLDFEGGVAVRLLLFGVAQVGIELAGADDAEDSHVAPLLAAEQRIGRLIGRAADEIVQRSLDRGFGAVVGVHARGYGRERPGDVFRRPALECRREIADSRHHALDRLAGHGWRGGSLAPADDTVIGFDAHEHVVRPSDLDARHEDRLLHGKADRDRLHVLDLHRAPHPCCSSSSTNAPRKSPGWRNAIGSPATLRCGLPAPSTRTPFCPNARAAFSTSSTPTQK